MKQIFAILLTISMLYNFCSLYSCRQNNSLAYLFNLFICK